MEEQKKKSGWYGYAQVVCGVLICVLLLYTFFFRVVNVSGSSMEYTLRDGERLVLSSFPYVPQRGDIVVLCQENLERPLIKRVIGLPGDAIYVHPDSGDVYLNGKKLTEPYIHDATATELMDIPVSVPAGCVFVMGDNRAAGNSLDSRTFGCVPIEDLVGKAIYRLLPLERMGGLYE